MDEDASPPEEEKPRFLLPEGCKDLIDVLRLQERRADMEKWSIYSVALSEPVTVRDLASALHRELDLVIHALMRLNIFASPSMELDFEIARKVCAHFGVTATRMA